MQITMAVISVDDQHKALQFYTKKLGFTKKTDMDFGPLRWLTVSAPEGIEGVELVLEKTDFPPAKAYQKARYDAGIPAIAFTTHDIQKEFAQLESRGVKCLGEPREMGPLKSVTFEDGCGNLVSLVQAAG
jgi:catechol 2,3-dioxygenase-like lactoylglutathione lyase family enzyme